MMITVQDLIDRYNEDTEYEYDSIVTVSNGTTERHSNVYNLAVKEITEMGSLIEFDKCVDVSRFIPDSVPTYKHIKMFGTIVEYVTNF